MGDQTGIPRAVVFTFFTLEIHSFSPHSTLIPSLLALFLFRFVFIPLSQTLSSLLTTLSSPLALLDCLKD